MASEGEQDSVLDELVLRVKLPVGEGGKDGAGEQEGE